MGIFYVKTNNELYRGKLSDIFYETTIHELAHAAHREVDGNAYNSLVWAAYTSPCAPSAESCDNPGPTGRSARRLMETWATTVEIVYARYRYITLLGNSNYRYRYDNHQNRSIENRDTRAYYTSAGYDMIDNINQRETYGAGYPQDRVSGYTLKQLEQALKGAKNWLQWRDNIKRMYNNPTKEHLDELFNNWTD